MNRYTYIIIVALTALMFSGCEALDAWLGIHEYRVGASVLEFSIPMRNGMKKAYEATITEDKITAYIDYDDYVAANGVFSPIVKASPGAQVIPASGSIIDVSYDENGGRHPTITYQVISEFDQKKGYVLGGKVYTVEIERLENAVASITRVEMLQEDNPELKQNYIADIHQHEKSITFTVRYNDFWDVLRNTPAYLKISATDRVKIKPDPSTEVDMSDLTDFRYTVTSEDEKTTYSYTLRILILPETMNLVTEFKLWELDMSEEYTAEIDQLTDTITVVFGTPHADFKGAITSTDQHITDFYSIKAKTRINPEVRVIGRIVGRKYRIPETPLKRILVKSGAGGGGRMERRIEDALTIKAQNGDLRSYDLVFSRGLLAEKTSKTFTVAYIKENGKLRSVVEVLNEKRPLKSGSGDDLLLYCEHHTPARTFPELSSYEVILKSSEFNKHIKTDIYVTYTYYGLSYRVKVTDITVYIYITYSNIRIEEDRYTGHCGGRSGGNKRRYFFRNKSYKIKPITLELSELNPTQ